MAICATCSSIRPSTRQTPAHRRRPQVTPAWKTFGRPRAPARCCWQPISKANHCAASLLHQRFRGGYRVHHSLLLCPPPREQTQFRREWFRRSGRLQPDNLADPQPTARSLACRAEAAGRSTRRFRPPTRAPHFWVPDQAPRSILDAGEPYPALTHTNIESLHALVRARSRTATRRGEAASPRQPMTRTQKRAHPPTIRRSQVAQPTDDLYPSKHDEVKR